MVKKGQKTFRYDLNEAERLRGIPLPEKIKCGRCSKNVARVKYSTKQLTDARRQIYKDGSITKPISCQNCSEQQIVELECVICRKTKGLEDFSKVQRSKPDTAKCYKCMDNQTREAAIDDVPYENPYTAFRVPDHSGGIMPDYFSGISNDGSSVVDEDEWNMDKLAHGTSRKKATDTESDGGIILPDLAGISLNDSGPSDAKSSDDDDGGWNTASTKSWKTGSRKLPSDSSHLTSGKYGDSSNTRSSHSFTSSNVGRSTATAGRSTAWAKKSSIPLGTPGNSAYAPVRPMGDTARECGPVVDAWGSDEEEDEDEDDYDSDDDDDIVI